MKPARRQKLSIGLVITLTLTAGTALSQSDKPPTRIEVRATTAAQDSTHPVPLQVSLKNEQNRPVQARTDVQIKLDVKAPNGMSQSIDATIPAGKDSAEISWLPMSSGVFKIKAKEFHDELLDGTGAFLVKPATVAPPHALPPQTPTQPPEKPKKAKNSQKVHKAFHPGLTTCQGPAPSNHHAALVTVSAPTSSGSRVRPSGRIQMFISVRDMGVLADGKDSAAIDLFYEAADGSGPPSDIAVWFHWEGGEVAPQPTIIKQGEAHAQSHWTASAPVAGTVTISKVHPACGIDGDTAAKVRFIKPIAGLNISGPTSMSIVDVVDLVVQLEGTDGNPTTSDIARSMSFVPQTTAIDVDPKQVQMAAGTLEARVTIAPKSLGKAAVVASTAGYPRRTHTIQITWLSVFVLALAGGALGGWLRYRGSGGPLTNRLLVGITVGCLAVVGYISGILPTTTTFVLHNLFSVPVGAILGGWLGLAFFDKVPGLSVLSGGKSGK